MPDPTDDDRPRSARPAVPPFKGPRDATSPRPATASPAAPRPFIPGVQGTAPEWPATPTAANPPEPGTSNRHSFDSAPPRSEGTSERDENRLAEYAAPDPAPALTGDPQPQPATIPEEAVYAPTPNDAEVEREERAEIATVDAAGDVAGARIEKSGISDQRLPALRFTGSSAFAAIPGASDGADVDASVDDAFSALDASTPRVQPQAVQPAAELVAPAEPPAQPAEPSVELPWLDTESDTAPAPTMEAHASTAVEAHARAVVDAEADAPVTNDATERVARTLEMIALRVRRGDLPLPASLDGAGDEAALAAVLAALLGSRG